MLQTVELWSIKCLRLQSRVGALQLDSKLELTASSWCSSNRETLRACIFAFEVGFLVLLYQVFLVETEFEY